MELNSSGIRQRKGLRKMVEDLDIFDKVVENVKEEEKVSSGIVALIVVTIIVVLFCSESYNYFYSKQYVYNYKVDVDMEDKPVLDIDMVIATPCSELQVSSSMDKPAHFFQPVQSAIKKDPTRFEFTDEEQMYWTILRHAHAEFNKDGLRGIEDLHYMDSEVENKLEDLAEEKQKEEEESLKKQRDLNKANNKQGSMGQVMFLVGNGMGMFQIVADNGGDDGSTACRIHGSFPVLKSKEERIVISISNPMMLFDHMEGKQKGNISHRIEKFHFGTPVRGLVTPLAGAEHISESGQDVYRYFIKVVPTIIYGHFSAMKTYQYSVTFLKKRLQEGEHSHGGILFEYEFTSTVIEVRRVSVSFVMYLMRLCSILGGVYATSKIIDATIQLVLSFIYKEKKYEPINHPTRTQIENTGPASLNIDPSLNVY